MNVCSHTRQLEIITGFMTMLPDYLRVGSCRRRKVRQAQNLASEVMIQRKRSPGEGRVT
jgi:hypothetical protein